MQDPVSSLPMSEVRSDLQVYRSPIRQSCEHFFVRANNSRSGMLLCGLPSITECLEV